MELEIYIDELSGVYNRRYLREKQDEEIKEYTFQESPFSVVWVDIDHFKEVNDTHGHIKGDEIIREFAQFLKNSLRESDCVIRYGGDEFICIMPNTKRDDAEHIYGRILKKCKARSFSDVKITISAGISSFPDDAKEFKLLLKYADESLYDAKRSGRDRIGTAGKKKIEIPIKSFIGRVKEKDVLQNILSDGKKMQLGIIKGNVGIGKTRLVKEVLNYIKGKEIIWSDCVFFMEHIAYYSIKELIKYRIQRVGKKILKDFPFIYKVEIGKLIPEVMAELGKEAEGIDPVLDRYRLYETVRQMIEKGEREKIIIIDNIQWIDNESIEVIKYLARSLRESPIRFIFIYRTEEETQQLQDFLSYISREVSSNEIHLEPFSHMEIKTSIKTIVGEKPTKDLLDYVKQESGGNPFFIEEIMRELDDKKYLQFKDNEWKFKRPEKDIVPKSIEGIAIRKYQSLSNEGQGVLDIASATNLLDIDILMQLTGYNEGHVIGILENIIKTGLIKEEGQRISFHEEMSRNAVYQKYVTGIKKINIHKNLAASIRKKYKGKEPEIIEELAFHYYTAQDKELGPKFCIEAGERTKEKYANANAIQYYTWAEELLSDAETIEKTKTRIDCLTSRAAVLGFIGMNDAAIIDLDNALQLAEEIEDKKREANIRSSKVAAYYNISQYRKAINEAANAGSIYKEIDDKRGYTKMLINMGISYRRLGNYFRALKTTEEAFEIYNEIKDNDMGARVLANIGNIYGVQGDYDKSLKYYKDALKLLDLTADKDSRSKLLNNIGTVCYKLGDYQKAKKFFDTAAKIQKEIGNRDGEANSLNNCGSVYIRLGNYDKAMKLYEKALQLNIDIGKLSGESLVLTNIGAIYRNRGENNMALKVLEESLKIAEEIESKERIFGSILHLADINIALKNIEKAEQYLNRALKLAKGSKDMLFDVLSYFCEFYLETKDFKNFNLTMRRLKKYAKDIKSPRNNHLMNFYDGRSKIEKKKYEEAKKQLTETLMAFEKAGEKMMVGQIYCHLATLESLRDNNDAAKEYVKEARKIFKAIGAQGWQEIVGRIGT